MESWPDSEEIPPRCPRCGGLLRPDVVWFGEMLPAATLRAAEHAAATVELFFSIGTSALVYPAADLPFAALNARATVVEISPQPTPLSPTSRSAWERGRRPDSARPDRGGLGTDRMSLFAARPERLPLADGGFRPITAVRAADLA